MSVCRDRRQFDHKSMEPQQSKPTSAAGLTVTDRNLGPLLAQNTVKYDFIDLHMNRTAKFSEYGGSDVRMLLWFVRYLP